MDLHHQTALLEAKNSCGFRVEDRLDRIHFDEVVPGTNRADLGAPARFGAS